LHSSTEIKIPYVQVPKVLRFLSFKKEDGTEIRINENHITLIFYLYELQECYKSFTTIERELGWGREKVNNIKKEIQLPTVELGVPIVVVSKFIDRKNNKRNLYEVFPHKQEMLSWYIELYEKENGKDVRDRWVNQWYICKGSTEIELGGSTEIELGVVRKSNSKEPNTKEPNIKEPKRAFSSKEKHSSKEEEKKKAPIKKKEIKFNRDTQTFENIPEEFLSSLESSFPLVDKDLAFQKMIIWLNGHNNRRASKEFIKKWFTGDQESAEYRKSRNCYSRRVQEKQEWEKESNGRPDNRVDDLKKNGSHVEADPDEETVNFMDSLNQHLNQEDTNATT